MATTTVKNTLSAESSIILKFNVLADLDNQVSPLDTDIVQKFTKTLLSGTTHKNFEVIQGKYTPANNTKVIREFTIDDNPKFLAFFCDKPIGLRVQLDGPGVNEVVYNLLIDDYLITNIRKRQGFGEYLYQVKLIGQTAAFADPADVDQGAEINYTLITAELV